MNHAQLKSTIAANAAVAAKVAAGELNAAAALLNARDPATPAMKRAVEVADIVAVLVGLGDFAKLRRSNDPLAGDVMWMLTRFDTFDFTRPQVIGMIDALIAANIWSANTKAALLSLASRPGSLVEASFGSDAAVTVADIDAAMRS